MESKVLHWVKKVEEVPDEERDYLRASSFHGEGEVHVVLADTWEEAFYEAKRLYEEHNLVDYDASFDTTSGFHVGFTCA